MRNSSTSNNSTVKILKPADVLDTLAAISRPVSAVMLDPWYNKGVGGEREDYDEWLESVIKAASNIASHIFVWGFPEIAARQITRLPQNFTLLAWLTWYYKNCPSVIRGWRSAQNTCLHIASKDAAVFPQHFLSDEQVERWKAGKMRFIPGPPTVLEAPLNIGFVGKREQTGHPAQKPLAVIETLLKMATKEGDVVVDPMCGAGTTGEACLNLRRHAILCDHSEEWTAVSRKRIKEYLSDKSLPRDRNGQPTSHHKRPLPSKVGTGKN